jgi:hypothetical protein
MTDSRSGGCQCGAIRFKADSLKDNAHVCHCRMCQKAHGNFFAALVGVPLSDFRWTRGSPGHFESSECIERGFCGRCGTPLYFRRKNGRHISLSIGAFDRPETIPLDFELGLESRLPQIDQLSKLPTFGSTEEVDPKGAGLARQTSRQHPDHDTDEWDAG